eukprot:9497171-Pyramimonas_sp.AAC.1
MHYWHTLSANVAASTTLRRANNHTGTRRHATTAWTFSSSEHTIDRDASPSTAPFYATFNISYEHINDGWIIGGRPAWTRTYETHGHHGTSHEWLTSPTYVRVAALGHDDVHTLRYRPHALQPLSTPPLSANWLSTGA